MRADSLEAELRARSATNSLIVISTQLGEARRELETAKHKLTQFQIENRMGNLDVAIQVGQGLIKSLVEARDHAIAAGDVDTAAAYDVIVADREADLLVLLRLDPAYTALDTDVSRFQSLYSLLLEKQTEAKFKENEARNAGFIQILEPARRPSGPSPFPTAKLLVAGAVVSVSVGVILALLLEYLEGLRMQAEGVPSGAVGPDGPQRRVERGAGPSLSPGTQ